MAVIDSILPIFLLLLLAVSVDSFDVGGHDLLATTIAYRKKPNTRVTGKCMPDEDLVCNIQDKYCAAYHVAKNVFVTAGHCLVGVDGFIHDPEVLEIVGVGKVNVSIDLHHKFDVSGVDVAWIHYKHPEELPMVRVAKYKPIECKMFTLDVFDPTASGIHAGHRWIVTNDDPDRAWTVKEPATGRTYEVVDFELTVMFLDWENISGDDHAVLCTAYNSPSVYELHYMERGYMERTLITVDCHFSDCGNDSPENVMPPVTTTRTTTSTTTPHTTTNDPPIYNDDTTEDAEGDATDPVQKPMKPRYNWGTLHRMSYSAYPFLGINYTGWTGGRPLWEAFPVEPLSHQDNTLEIDPSAGSPEMSIPSSSPTTQNKSSEPNKEPPKNPANKPNVTYFIQPPKLSFKSTTESAESAQEVQDYSYNSDLEEEDSVQAIPQYDYSLDEDLEFDDEIFYDHFPTVANYELLRLPITAAPPTMVAPPRRRCRKPLPTAKKCKPSRTEKPIIKTTPTIAMQDVTPKPVGKITSRNTDSSAVAMDNVSALFQTFVSVVFVFILTC